MTIMTRQYSAVASQASEAVEKAADSWVQGVRKLADRFPVLPQVDLVPAVERYFEFVQRAVDLNRGISLRWAQAAGTLSGAVRKVEGMRAICSASISPSASILDSVWCAPIGWTLMFGGRSSFNFSERPVSSSPPVK